MIALVAAHCWQTRLQVSLETEKAALLDSQRRLQDVIQKTKQTVQAIPGSSAGSAGEDLLCCEDEPTLRGQWSLADYVLWMEMGHDEHITWKWMAPSVHEGKQCSKGPFSHPLPCDVLVPSAFIGLLILPSLEEFGIIRLCQVLFDSMSLAVLVENIYLCVSPLRKKGFIYGDVHGFCFLAVMHGNTESLVDSAWLPEESS